MSDAVPEQALDADTDRCDAPPTIVAATLGLPKAPIAQAPEIAVTQPVLATPDPVLFAAVVGLVGFGIVMVYSASAVYANQKFGAATYFLRRDLLWAGLGLVAMTIALRTDYSFWKRYSYLMLGTSVGMLVSVLAFGARINGARRWFHVGGISFQPAEMAKVALVIYLAHSLSKKAEKVRSFTVGFVPHMIVCGVMMALLLKQPDLGTACILGLTTLLLLFVAGAQVSYIIIAFMGAAPIVYQAIVGTPWRMRRMLAYIDPWQYRYDVGYQITESLISVGSGGLRGLGLGDGRQKLFFLPEAHTDYIMAIVGEELGLMGILAVAATFVVIIWRGARAALKARDAFGCYLAFGFTAMFGLQAMVNIGVVLGALPTKGLPFPFVSFGGSTLVVDLFAIGILLDISRGADPRARRSMLGPTRPLVRVANGNRKKPGGGRRVTVEVA